MTEDEKVSERDSYGHYDSCTFKGTKVPIDACGCETKYVDFLESKAADLEKLLAETQRQLAHTEFENGRLKCCSADGFTNELFQQNLSEMRELWLDAVDKANPL